MYVYGEGVSLGRVTVMGSRNNESATGLREPSLPHDRTEQMYSGSVPSHPVGISSWLLMSYCI